MFIIKGRTKPLFSISELKIITEIAFNVFCNDEIENKNLIYLDYNNIIRINEINGRIFLLKESDQKWEINIKKHQNKFNSTNFLEKIKKFIKTNFNSHLTIINPNKSLKTRSRSYKLYNTLYDLRSVSKLRGKLPSGVHICLIDPKNLPQDISYFVGFNSDILVEYELNKFHVYKNKISNDDNTIALINI